MNAAFHRDETTPNIHDTHLASFPESLKTWRHRWICESERNLLLAVLQDAIKCYLEYREGDRNPRNRLLYSDAREWINSRTRYGVFAFQNLCETLGIEPGRLRRELNRRRARLREQSVIGSQNGLLESIAAKGSMKCAHRDQIDLGGLAVKF